MASPGEVLPCCGHRARGRRHPRRVTTRRVETGTRLPLDRGSVANPLAEGDVVAAGEVAAPELVEEAVAT